MNAMFEKRKDEDFVRDNITPKSQADRIRAMSDEELAVLLGTHVGTCHLCIHRYTVCVTEDFDCRDGILQWLKSEAKE